MKHLLSLAHSPDADDIFMYYAIVMGWVNLGDFSFTNTPLDIHTLNVEALKGTYDVSAISFALYPHIAQEYTLLRTATSFGQGYGPKLVKRKNSILKRNFKVALSGNQTTNALLFRIAYPNARIIYKNFLDIEEAVLSGEVDAGVLIHESILTFSEQLEVEREMWDVWCELAGDSLPLPLGGMAIRRSIPLTRAIEVEKALTQAVSIANNHKSLLSRMLQERDLVRVYNETLNRYLSMYANEDSIELNDKTLHALDKLFEIGYNHKFYTSLIKTENFLLPLAYEKVRFS